MSRLRLWWVPLLLLLAPATDRLPAHRDLVDYFLPMRLFTARALAAGSVPWLNPANGCGEVWFANPQTGVLYPPCWLYTLLPAQWALTAEIALHLTLLSLGIGLLARRWGAGAWGQCCAEVGAWCAGPVLVMVGVVNNLATTAWLPWMVLAAARDDRRALPCTALATAAAWLAGEPQLWALGVILAVLASRRRALVVGGVGLGVAVVAVQLVPFLVWIAEGDRGAGAAAWALEGAVAPAAWWGLLVPGIPRTVGWGVVYAESLFLSAPLCVCALLGVARRPRALIPVAVLAVLATLPEVGGSTLYLVLTAGMLRYPARFALLAIVCLLPFVGTGVARWRAGDGARVAAVVAVVTFVVAAFVPSWWHRLVACLPALVVLAAVALPRWRWLRDAAVLAGLACAAAAAPPLLDLRPTTVLRPGTTAWPEARSGGRLYTPSPSAEIQTWLARGLRERRLWPVGYLNLDQGLTIARSDAPVWNQRLTLHLRQANAGPVARWWLDSLAASWIVLPHGSTPAGMVKVRRHDGLWLYRNLAAQAEITIAAEPPHARQGWHGVGAVLSLRRGREWISAAVVTRGEGWAWISLAPLRSWQWRLDGQPVVPRQGPGIVQYLRVPAGVHRLEGRYRVPGVVGAGVVSACALLVLVWLLCAPPRRVPIVGRSGGGGS